MAMNHVQFQKGLSMAEFQQRYGTVAQCHAALLGTCGIVGDRPNAVHLAKPDLSYVQHHSPAEGAWLARHWNWAGRFV